ncbi:MAG: SURF1 family protein [Jatrophihabitantaceae bacterium]
MLRKMLWTVRQPRYAALAVGMFLLALACIGAGTWQISRFNQSVRENDALRANARALTIPLTTALVPLVNHGPTPNREAIRYRTVTVTGTYAGTQQFLRNQTLNGVNGYYAVNRLQISTGVLLIVRGFVTAANSGAPPATITPPPTGILQVTGLLQTPDSKSDDLSELSGGQLESVNPADQAARLGAPTYNAYLVLKAGQPGTAGIQVLPDPDLTNPAGGAYDWQHFAYILQWYLFALLALVAPFAIGRTEVREERRLLLGIGNEEFGAELEDGPDLLQLPGGSSADGAVAVRDHGTLARRGEPTAEQWQRAVRLADRYGRSLGPDHLAPVPDRRVDDGPPITIPAGVPDVPALIVPNSSTQAHRSHDSFHGSYNDYLWELGLADRAAAPANEPAADEPTQPPTPLSRRVVDALPAPDATDPAEPDVDAEAPPQD